MVSTNFFLHEIFRIHSSNKPPTLLSPITSASTLFFYPLSPNPSAKFLPSLSPSFCPSPPFSPPRFFVVLPFSFPHSISPITSLFFPSTPPPPPHSYLWGWIAVYKLHGNGINVSPCHVDSFPRWVLTATQQSRKQQTNKQTNRQVC